MRARVPPPRRVVVGERSPVRRLSRKISFRSAPPRVGSGRGRRASDAACAVGTPYCSRAARAAPSSPAAPGRPRPRGHWARPAPSPSPPRPSGGLTPQRHA